MQQKKILAIVGSLRTESYNRQLAELARETLGDRASFTILDYSDVPLFSQDIEHPAPEPVRRVREAIKSADGLWFFTPEYNHSYPGVLKNLIDWLSRPVSDTEKQVLIGKRAAISGVSTGLGGTAMAQDLLAMLIGYLNIDLMNQPRLVVRGVADQLDDAGRLTLSKNRAQLEKQTNAFLRFLERP